MHLNCLSLRGWRIFLLLRVAFRGASIGWFGRRSFTSLSPSRRQIPRIHHILSHHRFVPLFEEFGEQFVLFCGNFESGLSQSASEGFLSVSEIPLHCLPSHRQHFLASFDEQGGKAVIFQGSAVEVVGG